jgi:hypothetical protein
MEEPFISPQTGKVDLVAQIYIQRQEMAEEGGVM